MAKDEGFLYVPEAEIAIAMSYGAVLALGDSRLRIPTPLPDGVNPGHFERWTTQEMRVVWLAEFLEKICGAPVDLMNVAGLLEAVGPGQQQLGSTGIPLYVPTFEMNRVRAIPGVHWNRKIRQYVADRTANFELIFDYLTPAMRAVWIADRNLNTEIETLVKARALRYQIEGKDGGDRNEMERVPEERRTGLAPRTTQEDEETPSGW
jgi:hypothetical protein